MMQGNSNIKGSVFVRTRERTASEGRPLEIVLHYDGRLVPTFQAKLSFKSPIH